MDRSETDAKKLLSGVERAVLNLKTCSMAILILLLAVTVAEANDVQDVCMSMLELSSANTAPEVLVLNHQGGIEAFPVHPQYCKANAKDCKGITGEKIADGSWLLIERYKEVFACAHTSTTSKVISGWIPSSSIRPDKTGSNITVSLWNGRWKQVLGNAVIKISIENDGFVAESDKTHENPRGQAQNGGYFKDRFRPYFRLARTIDQVSNGRCAIQFIMLNKLIAVIDNHECGGENISFSGFYHN